MKPRLSFLFSGFVGLLMAVTLWARPAGGPMAAASGRLAFKSYGLEQGLGNLAVWHILQDRTGFIWVGTEDGLYRFDGSRFRAFGAKDGLPSTFVESLHQSPDGSLWAGTYAGLARFNGTRFETIQAEAGLPPLQITGLATAADGTLWVGTPQGPYLRPPGMAFQPAAHWPGGGVTALWASPKNAVIWAASWSQTRSTLLRGTAGAWTAVAGTPDFGPEPIQALAVDGRERVWARTRSGLWALAPGAGTFAAFAPALPPIMQQGSLYVDPQGRLWVTTNKGLYRIDGDQVQRLGVPEGLPKPWSSRVLEDREGSLWVGSNGLYRLQGGGIWRSTTAVEGLPDEVIWTVWRDRAHHLFVGTDNGLARETPGGWRQVPDTGRNQIRSVVQDLDGAYFMAGGPELLRWDPATDHLARFGAESGVLSRGGRIFRLLMDPRGTLWAATDGSGLLRGTGKGEQWTFRRQDLPGGNDRERVMDLHLDAAGRLWVAGSDGLAVLDGGRWKRFTAADGLEKTHVAYVAGTRGGALLLAYFEPMGLSLAEYDSAKGQLSVKEHLDTSTGLASDKVFLMGEDAKGNLWVGSGMGVDLVTPGRKVEHFSFADGLVNDDTNSMSFLADPNGDVWIGTSQGLARFDAHAYKGVPAPPVAAILSFKLGAQRFVNPSERLLQVPHGANTFEVAFSGLSYIREGSVKHQVRLVGLEPEWRLTENRSARYPALAPGQYAFEVRAGIGQGEWGPVSRIAFEVLPAWWQTWWFRTLLALTGLGLVFGVIRWRVIALHRRNQWLEATVVLRTREVQAKAVELEQANEALRNQSLTDPLTGLRNRRFLGVCMPEDVAQVHRVHRDVNQNEHTRVHLNIDLIFLMVDVDHFKTVNDQYGHAAGDRVLQQMAEVLRQATRDSDTVVRWGGEEFLVVARSAARKDATILAERIRSLVAGHAFDLGGGQVLNRTCSVGFAYYPFLCTVPDLFLWEQVIDLADHCLYAAKRGGRNAWVGIFAAAGTDPERLKADLPMNLGALIEAGAVQAVHSGPADFVLNWDIKP